MDRSENPPGDDPTRLARRRQQQQPSSVSGGNALLPRQSLVITSATTTTVRRRERACHRWELVAALAALVIFWIVCLVLVLARSDEFHLGGQLHPPVSGIQGILQQYRSGLRHEKPAIESNAHEAKAVPKPKDLPPPQRKSILPKPHLVSRKPNNVVVTADVRGNLGPADVVIQATPGTDWIHDRWQAASNMHGKQIPGEHWIRLEFRDAPVVADRIVLDWETAYADEYVIQVSSSGSDEEGDDSWILFDGRKPGDAEKLRTVTTSGKSPGVDEPLPLHVVHEIRLPEDRARKPFGLLKLRILKSKTGWGVSLWQLDVYGYRTDELQTSR